MTRKFIVAFMLGIATFASAQNYEAKSVDGTLVDMITEKPLRKVRLVIQNVETQDSFISFTNKDGGFSFAEVPYGVYEFKVNDELYKKDSTFTFELNNEHAKGFIFSTPIDAVQKVSWIFNWGDKEVLTESGNTYIQEHYWSHFTAKVIMWIYGLCLLFIFFYSVLQFLLAISYRKYHKKGVKDVTPIFDWDNAPKVTVQLPMFNEMYVADRIIETIAKFKYPADKLQIQVLDDSTDETRDIIALKVAEIAATGVNIQHIHRVDRTGYKAGALDDAMDRVEGDFIAIFDADFVPDEDFLIRTMPYFQNDEIGVVQTRWGHINKDFSLLTELQAFGLDGHFAIEQQGRNCSGHFINFNGTGGVWRKTCIEDAGGWEHDTLTEDLDLSYRAQLKGWKFKYLEDVIAPAELPITMSALKSQQHRWMKGGVEVFKKMSKRLVTDNNVKISDRIHGLSHLFNSSIFLFILVVALLSLLVLQVKDSFSDLNKILQLMGIFIISTLFLMFYYWNSFRETDENGKKSFWQFLKRFFQFLTMSMGLSLSNTVAVIEGYMGVKSSFVRTPKFNIANKKEAINNKYDKKKLSIVNILEGIFFVVFTFTALNRAFYGDFGMVPFHLMLGIGYGSVFFYSVKEVRDSNRHRG